MFDTSLRTKKNVWHKAPDEEEKKLEPKKSRTHEKKKKEKEFLCPLYDVYLKRLVAFIIGLLK